MVARWRGVTYPLAFRSAARPPLSARTVATSTSGACSRSMTYRPAAAASTTASPTASARQPRLRGPRRARSSIRRAERSGLFMRLQGNKTAGAPPAETHCRILYRQGGAIVKEPSGLVRLVLVQLERLGELGVARDVLLRQAQIDERQLPDPDARIPLAAVTRLWRVAAEHVADPAFGLRIGAETSVREWGLVGYAGAFSSTLGSALKRFAHYSRVMSDALVIRIDTEQDATWVRLDVQPDRKSTRLNSSHRTISYAVFCLKKKIKKKKATTTMTFDNQKPNYESPKEKTPPMKAYRTRITDLSANFTLFNTDPARTIQASVS